MYINLNKGVNVDIKVTWRRLSETIVAVQGYK
jgi:hypothetical protein